MSQSCLRHAGLISDWDESQTHSAAAAYKLQLILWLI